MRSVAKLLHATCAALLCFAASTLCAAEPVLSPEEIMAKAVARCQQPSSNAVTAEYLYTKVTVTEELDATGNVKERVEKVYEVSFRGGASSVRLIEVNGHPPGPADRKKQADNQGNTRQLLGSSKGDRSSSNNQDRFLSTELVARYNFRLVRQISVNDRPAYELSFSPKSPEPPVHRVIDRLLNRLSGTIWIDAQEFEVARADIVLGSEVNLLGGVVGSLKKLSFTIRRTRLPEGLWFSTSSNGDFEGRKLLDSTRIKTRSHSINFRPLG